MEQVWVIRCGRRMCARMVGEYARSVWRGRPQPEDSILICGGGRSGTTWLGELISRGTATQEIFEPLIPFWNPTVRSLTGWQTDGPWVQGWYLRKTAEHPEWRAHLCDVLTGRVRHYWSDANRTSWFPRRYLVKEIRANLMLGFIITQFSPKVVFIVRNPYDMIASRIGLGWQVDLSGLVEDKDLVDDYLGNWVDGLRAESNSVGKHAAWWAVENLVALSELKDTGHPVVVYADLLRDPVGVAMMLRQRLGIESALLTPEDARRPSRMGKGRVPGGHSKEKGGLSVSDQKRIEQWVCRDELLAVLPQGVLP